MEALAASAFLLGLVVFAVLYQVFLEWLLPKFFPNLITSKNKSAVPSRTCPRSRFIPDFYLCQHCGARWLKLPGSPFANASDAQHDVYYGPDVPRHRLSAV